MVKWSGNEKERVEELRKNLKEARQKAGMTQKQVAECLNVCERHYKYIEAGKIVGNVELWDKLEDLFNIHQRKLREIATIHPGQEDNQ